MQEGGRRLQCPECRHEVNEEARFCPTCGTALQHDRPEPRVLIQQQVAENAGNVIGVHAGVVQGDVYGGDIYEVQVYAVQATDQTTWTALLDRTRPPYPFLAPYTARDRAIFKGREVETRRLVRRLGEQRLVLLYGKAGVGKTSLLAAGVIPELVSWNALVVHVQEYTNPLEVVHRALRAQADRLAIPLPPRPSIPELARAVQNVARGTFVLVLDHVERLFDGSVPSTERAAFFDQLDEALEDVDPLYFRAVFVVDEAFWGALGPLQDRWPGLFRAPLALQPLTHRQAQAAIEEPLAVLDYPVTFTPELVREFLLLDLDALTPEMPGRIYPPHLQMVCFHLYEAAREHRPPLVDHRLYEELGGAEAIVARAFDEMLRNRLADQEPVARRLLVAMAAPGRGRWVAPSELAEESDEQIVRQVMDRLVDVGLLVRRQEDTQRRYAFAGEVVRREAQRMGGASLDRRYRAEEELEWVWRTWLARRTLPTPEQLVYLAAAGQHVPLSPERVLLLVRAAVVGGAPLTPWANRLKEPAASALVRALETGAAGTEVPPEVRRGVLAARQILELDAVNTGMPLPETREAPPFGAVAWCAITHPLASVRQTAAVALTALGAYAAVDRLEWALRYGTSGWRRALRRSELRSLLGEINSDVAALNRQLPPLQRAGAWLWGGGRRIFHRRHELGALMAGGAVGMGLMLGVLRGGIAALSPQRRGGVEFAVYSYWGFLLGLALTAGTLVADCLIETAEHADAGEQAGSGRAFLGPVVLGGVLFGLMHLLVAWFNGLVITRAPLVVVAGFVLGLGLAAAVVRFPLARGRQVARLVWAALVALGVQAFFLVTGAAGSGLAVGWSGAFYQAEFFDWGRRLFGPETPWFDVAALADAAIMGGLMALGQVVGVAKARAWYTRWKRLVEER